MRSIQFWRGEKCYSFHYEDNDHKFKNGDLVLLDLGAQKTTITLDISYNIPGKWRHSLVAKTNLLYCIKKH